MADPRCAPVNASPPALRPSTHDSGSGWLAGPFPCDSSIHNSSPVLTGALSVRWRCLGGRVLAGVPSGGYPRAMADVTHILAAVEAGDPKAAAELLPLV